MSEISTLNGSPTPLRSILLNVIFFLELSIAYANPVWNPWEEDNVDVEISND